MTRNDGEGRKIRGEVVEDCALRMVRDAFESAVTGEGSSGGCWLGLSELARRAREALVARALGRVSVDEVAEAVGRSRFHVCRVFKLEVGVTINQYLQRIRVSEALHRLGDGGEDLLELALDLGYSSHSHFTSVFRSLIGVPPSRVGERLECGEMDQGRGATARR